VSIDIPIQQDFPTIGCFLLALSEFVRFAGNMAEVSVNSSLPSHCKWG
jgi:hypothetical protein